jgi:hypothetical protein
MMQDPQSQVTPGRPAWRSLVATIVITSTVSLALGVLLRQPTMMAANDISRWCTVWSLLERGTYVIDECPWQIDTQDKVERTRGSESGNPDAAKHYYSSKPALLPTLIAGVLYPARVLSGIPLDRVVLQEREERWSQKMDESAPGKVKGVLEKPKDAVKWQTYVFYFKPVLVLLNIVPLACFLVLFARVLDRYAASDWAWLFSLLAAAVGTYLLPFTQTLNNHTVAAFSVFFALYQFLRIWDEWEVAGWRFAAVGFFAAFTAVNEIPALSFLVLVLGLLLLRYPRQTILWAIPGALFPLAASVLAQYAALGEFTLVYTEFGTESYLFEGSLWKTPLELDALNLPWFDPQEAARRGIVGESYGLYLFHMTLGHHGLWSLTPVFLFSLAGLARVLRAERTPLELGKWLCLLVSAGLIGGFLYEPATWQTGGRLHPYLWVQLAVPLLLGVVAFGTWFGIVRRGGPPMAAVGWMTAVLTIVLLAFYTWNPKARNYGGSTQGLRWLFWLIPFWLLLLPAGVDLGSNRRWVRGLALLALTVSVVSVGYAMRNPWSHPWILDALEHAGVYTLPR